MKFKHSKIYSGLLKQEILVTVGGTPEQFESYFKRATKETLSATEYDLQVQGRTIQKNGFVAVWTDKGQPGLIAHEALHAAFGIFESREIKPEEELLCYIVEWIVRDYLRALKLT